MRISIIGAGNFGTAIAYSMAKSHARIVIYDIVFSRVEDINLRHQNYEACPGIILPSNIQASQTFDEFITQSNLVVVVVSAGALGMVLTKLKDFLHRDSKILNLSKGLNVQTGETLDKIYFETLGYDIQFGTAAGPSFAKEIFQNDPTTLVLGTFNQSVFEQTQKALTGSKISLEQSNDILGIGLCSALKNVMAIATGMHYGLKMGYNSKFTLLTKAILEVQSLVKVAGGQIQTIWSPVGVGDLLMTATSENSRNYLFGKNIAEGLTIDESLKKVGSTVEGFDAIKPCMMLKEKYGLKMPILEAVNNIIFHNYQVKETIPKLLD